jgi:site-specific DNA-methyltransferase (cytosine-N4-specific)
LIKFIQGNCIDKIKELDDNSIDCVVSSPPYYGLRDYGTAQWQGGNPNCEHKKSRFNYSISDKQKSNSGSSGLGAYKSGEFCKCGAKRIDEQFGLEKTYQDYLANTVKVFETFKPKLKDTATIWWNVGDSYSNHKDCKSIGQTLAKGTSREKAHEIEKGKSHTRDSKLLKASGLKDKDLMMIPNRVAIALQDAGWYIRSEIIWHKPNPMPESIRDRPTSCHEKIWLITKNKKYYYDAASIKEPVKHPKMNHKSTKHSLKQKKAYFENIPTNIGRCGNSKDLKKNKRNVWTITTKPFKAAHFATFPPDLIEPCIKAGCPEGGVVLDPFGGAGTTGIVAKSLNRQSILIELNPEYIKIAKKRAEMEFGLFNESNITNL